MSERNDHNRLLFQFSFIFKFSLTLNMEVDPRNSTVSWALNNGELNGELSWIEDEGTRLKLNVSQSFKSNIDY